MSRSLTCKLKYGKITPMESTALQVVARRVGGDLLPNNTQWVNRIQIRSETSSRLYVVAQRRSDLSWACSCFGWKSHRHCKHLDNMVPLLEAAIRPENLR